jgi:hypothetical protein
MQASENDSKTFHKLIRMQRSNSNINTDILILDGTKYTEDELIDGWKMILFSYILELLLLLLYVTFGLAVLF